MNPFEDGDGGTSMSPSDDDGETTFGDTFDDGNPSTSSTTSTTSDATTSMTTGPGDGTETTAVDTATTGGMDTTTGPADSSGGTTTAAGSDGNDTFEDGDVHVEIQLQNMWNEGECNDVTVTNISNMQVTWEVDIDVAGAIYQLWNAEVVAEMGMVTTFSGVAFNESLAPSQSAMFGFCVNY
jgi:cellulase/cellobiase CelA1